jgi:flagellar export protein FliJ
MVKKFQFRLERVLQHKKLLKNERMKELLEQNAQLQEHTEKKSELETALLLHGLEEKVRTSAEQLYLLQEFGNRMREEIEKTKNAILETEKAIQAATERYVQANKEEKTFQTLKEKKQEEFHDIVQKHEAAELDEFGVQRAKKLE